MWEINENDFKVIDSWGLGQDPFQAVKDFNQTRTELRWLNPEQIEIYNDYVRRRNEYVQNADFDKYYREAFKPIDKERWTYLMKRKAWYIMPLGWDNIAKTGGLVADFGAGDGDTVQRVIDYVASYWKANNITDKKLHIVGIDLNQSRVDNAKKLIESNHPQITFEFKQGDLINGLDFSNQYFDYSLCCGVLEILNDDQCNRFMDEMCRLTKKGIFVEDLFERFPGGHPRDCLGLLFLNRQFITEERHVILSEPFNTEKMSDPKKLWPSLLVQNIWLNRK